MAHYSELNIQNVIVFGGTGAQGSSIVKANYESEAGLRAAFAGQDACYFNINSFSVREADEYFWTFRAYEIAVQSKLKWFILAGGPDRLKEHSYEEKYRNSHGTVKARLSDWLSHQPLEILPWTILHGGVYAQMLSSLLRPQKGDDDVYRFYAPIGTGTIPFVDLDHYGVKVRYGLENPEECVGKKLGWAPWIVTYPEVVEAFRKATGKEAVFQDVSQEQWFEGMRAYVDPGQRMPRGVPADDQTAFTFKQSFGAWWNLWKDNISDYEQEKNYRQWSDKVDTGRLQSLEGWMTKTHYTGDFKEAQKHKAEVDT